MTTTNNRRFAVVTGGSAGIGLELARQFASNGFDVLLAAEDDARLPDARNALSGTGVEVTAHAADLSTEAGVDSLVQAIGDRAVDAIAINAGVGLGGAFVDTDLGAELSMIDLNVRGAVQLAKPVVRAMAARGQGRVLFTSSVAGTMPDPFEAVYGSTKVFLRWFSEALREELKDTGVTVTALLPSTTETDFFRRAGMMDTKAGTMEKDSAAVVAKAGYDALMAGKDKVVPTAKNKVMAAVANLLPDPVAAKQHRALSEPGTAEKGGGSSLAPPVILGAAGMAALGVGAALFAHWRNGRDEARNDARATNALVTPVTAAGKTGTGTTGAGATGAVGDEPGATPLGAQVPTAVVPETGEVRVGA